MLNDCIVIITVLNKYYKELVTNIIYYFHKTIKIFLRNYCLLLELILIKILNLAYEVLNKYIKSFK